MIKQQDIQEEVYRIQNKIEELCNSNDYILSQLNNDLFEHAMCFFSQYEDMESSNCDEEDDFLEEDDFDEDDSVAESAFPDQEFVYIDRDPNSIGLRWSHYKSNYSYLGTYKNKSFNLNDLLCRRVPYK